MVAALLYERPLHQAALSSDVFDQPIHLGSAGTAQQKPGQRLSAARAELAQPADRGSAQARGLAEQLAAFAPAELGRLPGQDGVGQGHA